MIKTHQLEAVRLPQVIRDDSPEPWTKYEVAVIMGPAGMNLGAGMTGGLAYLLRDSIGGYGYNQHSVRVAPIEVREEVWLRRVLRKHLRLTGSPRAAALLADRAPLPFLRVEPLALPCTIAETWATTSWTGLQPEARQSSCCTR